MTRILTDRPNCASLLKHLSGLVALCSQSLSAPEKHLNCEKYAKKCRNRNGIRFNSKRNLPVYIRHMQYKGSTESHWTFDGQYVAFVVRWVLGQAIILHRYNNTTGPRVKKCSCVYTINLSDRQKLAFCTCYCERPDSLESPKQYEPIRTSSLPEPKNPSR
jgi:hypothetical protein